MYRFDKALATRFSTARDTIPTATVSNLGSTVTMMISFDVIYYYNQELLIQLLARSSTLYGTLTSTFTSMSRDLALLLLHQERTRFVLILRDRDNFIVLSRIKIKTNNW